MFNNSKDMQYISSTVKSELYPMLEELIKTTNLKHCFKPHSKKDYSLIHYKIKGPFEELIKFNVSWSMIEEKYNNKPKEIELNRITKIIYKINNKLPLNLPIYKITNNVNNKVFILFKKGNVIIKNKYNKNIEKTDINLLSDEYTNLFLKNTNFQIKLLK